MDWRDFGPVGTFTGSASSLGDARIRHIYGTWNFGAGELLVGQTWPITDAPVSGLQRSGGGLQPYGGLGADIARVPQIRLTFGGFRLGFLAPWTQNYVDDLTAGSTFGAYSDTDTTLPKIEASYKLDIGDMGQVGIYGGYQTYDMEDNTNKKSESIASWVAALRGKFNFGPAYVNAIINYSINPANYGKWQGGGISGQAAWDGSSLQDYKLLGFAAAVGFKINDMISVEAGYGKNDGEWDVSNPGTWEQDNSAYYVNLPITLALGVKVVPEFYKLDFGETQAGTSPALEDGNATGFGAVWYISF
jgi:hypothetical protein